MLVLVGCCRAEAAKSSFLLPNAALSFIWICVIFIKELKIISCKKHAFFYLKVLSFIK